MLHTDESRWVCAALPIKVRKKTGQTDGQTDHHRRTGGRTPDRYSALTARRGSKTVQHSSIHACSTALSRCVVQSGYDIAPPDHQGLCILLAATKSWRPYDLQTHRNVVSAGHCRRPRLSGTCSVRRLTDHQHCIPGRCAQTDKVARGSYNLPTSTFYSAMHVQKRSVPSVNCNCNRNWYKRK